MSFRCLFPRNSSSTPVRTRPHPQGRITTAVGPAGEVVVGGGDGSASVLEPGSMRMLATTKLASGVTSCVVAPGAHKDGGFGMYCGTASCSVYYLKWPHPGILSELIQTHAEDQRRGLPLGYSEVFATCGSTDVRGVAHQRGARAAARSGAQRECLSVRSCRMAGR